MNFLPLRTALVVLLTSYSFLAFGQTPAFINTLQGSGLQEVHDIDQFPNGDIVIVGEFSGVVDFDPSAATSNLSSAGSKDIFVAKYTANGTYLWAFGMGSGAEDGAHAVVIDNNEDVVVTGYYRNTVDFDPGVGTNNLIANGFTGTNVGFGGDIFVAKYSSIGNHIWSFGVGGDYIQDAGYGIDVDDNDNIYVAGAVNTTSNGAIDFDPGPGVFNLAGSPNGLAFAARYSATGTFDWAFCIGGFGLNSAFDEVKVVPGDTTFVITGHFIGTNVDFDPGPGVANLSTNGFNDIVLAKYSFNSNYLWAFNIGGPSASIVDQAIGLKVDAAKNCYITGYVGNNNVDFDPGPGTALVGNNGDRDIFLAKYNEFGDYRWAHSFGGSLADFGFGVDVVGSSLINVGYFQNTVDFDPGPGVFNLTSNGGNDMYVSQFDTAGNFQCAFQVGGSGNDFGRDILMTGANSFYVSGGYSSNPIDFDPTPATLSATNGGGQDGFWGQYQMGCPQPDTIINHYAALLSFDTCSNEIVVDNANDFNVGDIILMIQMKGAIIDSTNTPAFGTILSYNGAGNYEENIIQGKVGNVITLQNQLLRAYDIPNGKVQIVSIPQFANYAVNTNHTAADWDGNKGGILAMNVIGTLSLNADINVNGKGFRGGTTLTSSIVNCGKLDYFYPVTNNEAGQKGEGIATVSLSKLYGRGKLASGGGGGNSHNAGGGGGSNGGAGGLGGFQFNYPACTSPYIANIGGLGGGALNYSSASNKIFLGGGGGCGHANNQGGNNGGNGGGIVYIKSNNLITNSLAKILANGDSANYGNPILIGVNDDGGNGGGSGGTVLLQSPTVTNLLPVNVTGGNGSNAHTGTTAVGPGGGGSGGVFWCSQIGVPANITVNAVGGQNGVVPQVANTNFGAQPGQSGQSLTSLNMPVANILFIPFTAVTASNDNSICSGQSAQLNASGAITYSWSPAAGLSSTTIANPVATPAVTTQYVVTGTDINGCTDMDTVTITVTSGLNITITASSDSICTGGNVTLTASGGNTYSWTGGVTNGVPFSPLTTNTYTVTGSANGCSGTANYTITVVPIPNLNVSPIQPVICAGDTVFFNATGAQFYTWSPATFLSNPFIANPLCTATANTTYTITGSNGAGCYTQALVNVTVNPTANIVASVSKNPICAGEPVTLSANGAVTYVWTNGVTNGVSFSPNVSNTYTVTGTDANGCENTATVSLTVNTAPVITAIPTEPVLCEGDSVWLSATGAISYLWSPGATLSTPTLDSTQSFASGDITYTVTGTDANGCKGTQFVNLDVINNISLELSKSGDIYCNAMPIQLAAKGGHNNYSWSPAQLLSNATIANPVANITKTTTFYVRSRLGNCLGKDSITVFYYDNTESGVFMPNAFSPNGDGLNDCYKPVSQGNYDQFEFKIFNRWGQSVFESTNANICWDGNLGPEPAPVGTYFYYLKASGECGTLRKQGDINLIR